MFPAEGAAVSVVGGGRQVLSWAAGTDRVCFSRSQAQGLSEGTVLVVVLWIWGWWKAEGLPPGLEEL